MEKNTQADILLALANKYLYNQKTSQNLSFDLKIAGVEELLYNVFSKEKEEVKEEMFRLLEWLIEDVSRFKDTSGFRRNKKILVEDDFITNKNTLLECFTQVYDVEIIKHLLKNPNLTLRHLKIVQKRKDGYKTTEGKVIMFEDVSENRILNILETASEVCIQKKISLKECTELSLLDESFLSVKEKILDYVNGTVVTNRTRDITKILRRNSQIGVQEVVINPLVVAVYKNRREEVLTAAYARSLQ